MVGNGVEEGFFSPTAMPIDVIAGAFGLRPGQPYLVAVGGLHEIKGATELLALAAELANRAPDFRLIVVGRNEFVHQQVAEGLPNVILREYLGATEGLPELMSGAVAVVILSRYETFGIPAIEAMAAGTPVVASRGGALPEIIGDAGLLCDPSDATALAEIMINLADRSGRREELIERGRERARLFTWDRCVERVVTAFRSRL